MFTQLFDFKRAFLARIGNKRSHPRHAVGDGFPLQAVLALADDKDPGPRPDASRDPLGGHVGNISLNGLSVVLPTSASLAAKQPLTVCLTIDHHSLEIPGLVVHFRVYDTHAVCGVEFELRDAKIQKTYYQLVEAVNLGASFVPVAGRARTPPGTVRRSWRSAHKTVLTEWRATGNPAPERFELTLGKHTLAGQADRLGLVIQPRKKGAPPVPAAMVSELRQLFRWVVPNLSKQVPADLRALMTRVAANNPPSLADTAPVARWQAPKAKPLAPS